MKQALFVAIFSILGNMAFADSPVENKDSTEYYMDYVAQRIIYTKVGEMPKCELDFNAYLFKGLETFIAEKQTTDRHGEIAFILEPDGGIRHCRVVDSAGKDIDIVLIKKIKQGAKYWTVGKHNEKAVPVEIRVSFNF